LQSELLNRNFFFLDLAGVQRRFLDEYPEFSQLNLQRAFPAMWRARVAARQPLALVVPSWLLTAEATPSAEVLIEKGAYFIDEAGYLFRRTASLSVTLPYLYDKGEKPAFWQSSLKVLAGLKKLSLNIVAVEQDERGLTKLSTEEGLTIYLSPTQEVERQLTVLQLIIEKYKIEGKRLKEIDLRFKEPVVEY
jgi:cell division septal protein FtsQ